MGQPVVHFEITGKDGEKLKRYYAELFGWKVNSENPMNYGMVEPEGNASDGGGGIGGGICSSPDGSRNVTVYISVPDVEAALAKAESLGGSRIMGPDKPMEGLEIGLFTDPEGNMVGVVKTTA